jgi:hypothetical protein
MPRSSPIRATTAFDRRARESAGKEQHARIRPQKGETPALGQGVHHRCVRHQPCHRHQHRHARQALAASLRAVAALIDPERCLHHRRERCLPGLGLDHEAAERHTTDLTARQTEHMGTEPLGPTVQRRVRRGARAEQLPSHVAQARRALGVGARQLGDHGHRVLLVGQDVVRQDAGSGAAPRATREHDRGLQVDADQLPEGVAFQQNHSTRDDRGAQYQRLAEARCTAPIIGDMAVPPVEDALPEAASRRYDREC